MCCFCLFLCLGVGPLPNGIHFIQSEAPFLRPQSAPWKNAPLPPPLNPIRPSAQCKAQAPGMPSCAKQAQVEAAEAKKEHESEPEKEEVEGDEKGREDGDEGEEKKSGDETGPEEAEGEGAEGEAEQKADPGEKTENSEAEAEDPEKMRHEKSEDLPKEKVRKRPHRRKPTPPSSESSMSTRMKRQDGSRFVHSCVFCSCT